MEFNIIEPHPPLPTIIQYSYSKQQNKKSGIVLPIPLNLGSGGFEPSKAEPTDLQSAPFDRSGNSPNNNHTKSSKLFVLLKHPPLEPPPGFEPETS
jgi:hypothetical protein